MSPNGGVGPFPVRVASVSLKVLVVDDSPAVRLVLRSALARVGVDPKEVFDCEDPVTAWSTFRRVHPELVLMDLSLQPRVDYLREDGAADHPEPPSARAPEAGEDLAKRMLYADPALKLVVCTGHPPDSPSVREVVKYGAYCVFFKPIGLENIHRLFQLLAADGLTLSTRSRHAPEAAQLPDLIGGPAGEDLDR